MEKNSEKKIAYFCMEFGLHQDFRIYSGGLGILAGDVLKAAYDEGLPIIGIGILWRQGYTRQFVDEFGKPFDSFYAYEYPFLEDTGKIVEVEIRKKRVKLKIWKCTAFENNPLYLLDAFIPDNNDMLMTDQLYGWFGEERLAQEIILGVGGVRALEALKIEVDIYHFNDSHPVVAGLELIREKMREGVDFETAWQKVCEKIVFTTHTPIVHGNESYQFDILNYMGINGEVDHLPVLTNEQLKMIGSDPFSMTVAGLQLSKKANAVAQLHGKTANEMWKNVEKAAPIYAITNGVHNKTWQSQAIYDSRKNTEMLWQEHQKLKSELFDFVCQTNGVKLDKDRLTIGFARRAATYKRSDLIFRDEKTIDDMLKTDKIQLIFSGKAHPNDIQGKKIIENLVKKSKQYPGSVVFLQDYDIEIGKLMTRGCDVWLNNPVRPLEASGTSGMKAAMNGVLNCSTLDGWWPEGCVHGENGWQFGDGYVGTFDDQHDLYALYAVLQNEVIPCYVQNKQKWIQMMQNSIEMSTEAFSASRMLREYYKIMYQ